MPQQKVIFDLDDFCQDQSALELLFKMHARFPNFKVNLFTIPMRCDRRFLDEVSRLDWVSLIQHGWKHTNCESERWTKHEAENYFRTAQGWTNKDGKNVFCQGFKAPNWRLNQNTVDAVASAGLWLADNADPDSNPNRVVVPGSVKRYYFHGDMITDDHAAGDWVREHGHIGPMDCTNELLYTYHYLQGKLDNDAQFYFIEDVIADLYGNN